MMIKPLLLLAALTLCCCITSLHAIPGKCRCIRTSSTPIPFRVIKKIEVIPISGHCRRTEIIVTRRNESKVCVNPHAAWINVMLQNLKNKIVNSDSTTVSPTASTTHI